MARCRAHIRRWLATALLWAAAPAAYAQHHGTHIYATDWGMTLKSDGTGFYNDLADFLLPADAVGATQYEILPYRRAVRAFVAEGESCLYPGNIAFLHRSGLIEDPAAYIEGPPVLSARQYVFSPPDSAAVTGPGAMAGKTLAYAMGASTPYMLKDTGAFFIAVADETDKARLLLSGRVDLMVAAMPDAAFVFRALGVEVPPHDPAFLLDAAVLSITCHATDDNRTFLNRLAAHVHALRETGKMADFFTRNGLDPDLYAPK